MSAFTYWVCEQSKELDDSNWFGRLEEAEEYCELNPTIQFTIYQGDSFENAEAIVKYDGANFWKKV